MTAEPKRACLVTGCEESPRYLVIAVPDSEGHSPAQQLAACGPHVVAALGIAITPERRSVVVHGLRPYHVTTYTAVIS